MGLAWLPYWLIRERVQAGTLEVLLPGQPEFLYDCHALWLQTPHLPLRIRLAVDALAAALPKFMAYPSHAVSIVGPRKKAGQSPASPFRGM